MFGQQVVMCQGNSTNFNEISHVEAELDDVAVLHDVLNGVVVELNDFDGTCGDFAQIRLRNRAIKSSTLRNYLGTLDSLGLSDVPASSVTLAMLTDRLDGVLTPSTRRKHIINLRATLGVPLKCPRAEQTIYDLPDFDAVKDALENSRYRFYGLLMLFAGLRIGEACTTQPINNNVLTVNRQRKADGSITRSKTEGPVIVPEWLASEYRRHSFDHANNTVYIGIVRAGKKAGLSIKPHMLRHMYATELVRKGASPEVLRRQMRHHDVTVSLRYYVQTTQTDVEGVVNLLA